MDGALGIAVGGLLVIGICVQLAVALRNRYITTSEAGADAEKDGADAENFATELDLQLQRELDDAINASTPLLSPGKGSLIDVSPQDPTFQVRFAEDVDDSSWTTFKRESRAKIQQLAKSLSLLAKDDDSVDEDSTDAELATSDGHFQPPMTEVQQQRFVRRQLPLLDSDGALAERNVLVNAKQYSRILKRRYARQLMEDYFRSQPKRKPATFSGTGCMRRPRGPGGRFLTAEEVHLMEAGPMVNGIVAAQ